jgi:hypothetical protein
MNSPSIAAFFAFADEPPSVARDHQIFVRPDHPGGCFAVAFCNPRAACGICRRVDFQPEPARFLADPMANFRSVLAYVCSENEGIKPAQKRRPTIPARDRCGSPRVFSMSSWW